MAIVVRANHRGRPQRAVRVQTILERMRRIKDDDGIRWLRKDASPQQVHDVINDYFSEAQEAANQVT